MAKAKETKKAMSAEEKAAKKKARLEAIKNRPAGQRCNSKQVDVIETENGTVETWGYPVVAARKHIGVLTTTIVKDKGGNVISTGSWRYYHQIKERTWYHHWSKIQEGKGRRY